jgi:hypothetical protein
MPLDVERITKSVTTLRESQSTIFGASSHRFLLNDKLTETEVEAFERLHKVRLPSDYRNFLKLIGNGGAGPFYGVFRLGTMDDPGFSPGNWRDEVGILSEPFPYETEPSDPIGKPTDEIFVVGPEGYRRMVRDLGDWKNYDDCAWYWAPLNGAIPICHVGCGYLFWLVLTGSQAGRMWHDGRAAALGLEPVLRGNGSAVTFATWYEEWLNGARCKAQP